jgi:hypothetical protein
MSPGVFPVVGSPLLATNAVFAERAVVAVLAVFAVFAKRE